MAPRTLTSSNAIILIGITNLFPTPQQLAGFAADDVTDVEPLDNAETSMGVDGILSAGFVFVPVKQSITLQADSVSNDMFDTWYATEQQLQDKLYAIGTIVLPGAQKRWSLARGVLSSYKPIPDVKKTLQPRKYEITWNNILPSAL